MNTTFDWSTVYQYWKMFEENYPGLTDQKRYLNIKVDMRRPGPVHHYNWVNRLMEKKAIQKDIKTLEKEGAQIGTNWSKGTLVTAELLTNCKTAEERAAVWISATALTWIRNSTANTQTVQNATEIAMQSNALFAHQYGYWGKHAKAFFPMPSVLRLLLNEANDLSSIKLIEIAAASANYALTRYTPVKYCIRTF